MILLIGNKFVARDPGHGVCVLSDSKRRAASRGFTFFEIMVTVAILSMGVVMIYKALLVSLDHQESLMHRLYAMNLVEEKITAIQRNYQESGNLPLGQSEETHRIMLNNKPVSFQFIMDFNSLGDLEDIFRLDLTLSWRERGRFIHLSRSAYVHRF